MHRPSTGRYRSVVPFLLYALVACWGGDSGADASEGGNQRPCDVLTAEEVATVLPNADDGYVASDGGSLMQGVDSYQCSYSNPEQEILTVTYHVAADADSFDWIRPDASSLRMIYGDALREVAVGDEGYLYYGDGDPSDLKLKAAKGLHVVEIELMAADAASRADAMVPLGVAVLDRTE